MTSSQFSFDDFDAFLEPLASSGVAGSAPPSAPRSTALTISTSSFSPPVHGESVLFDASLLGSGVNGGVPGGGFNSGTEDGAGITPANIAGEGSTPGKRNALLLEPSPALLCMGLVSTNKFCTKVLVNGATSCGASAHVRKFHPSSATAYFKDNEVRAFCKPVFDLTIMSTVQRLRIQGVVLTLEEWSHLFVQVQRKTPPKWLTFEDPPSVVIEEEEDASTELLSPVHAAAGSLLGLIPMLSFEDSVSSGEDENSEPMDHSLASFYIQRFRRQFISLKNKWERAFAEVESGYGMIVKDLQKLHQVAESQAINLGTPVALGEQMPDSVWKGLSQVHQTVTSVSSDMHHQATNIAALSTNQTHLTQSVITLETTTEDINTSLSGKVSTLTIDLRALEARILRLVPVLAQLRRNSSTPNTPIQAPVSPQLEQFGMRLGACEQSVSSLRNIVSALDGGREPFAPPPSSSAIESQLKEIQVQMKQLQLKVVGKGVQIANRTFHTFEDVKVWVDMHLPTHRYGLFVDGVSLFEFFTSGHIDAETTYTSFYSQHRTGFKSTFEARVASSVQNLFPTVFGKSDSV
jgi:hypothetical protein